MYTITFYRTRQGENPVESFMDSLDSQTQKKLAFIITNLKEMGPMLKRPHADKLKGKIYELRPKQARILYFFFYGHEIVLLHGFLKKTDKVDPHEIDIAEKRRIDWIERHQGREAIQ